MFFFVFKKSNSGNNYALFPEDLVCFLKGHILHLNTLKWDNSESNYVIVTINKSIFTPQLLGLTCSEEGVSVAHLGFLVLLVTILVYLTKKHIHLAFKRFKISSISEQV